MKATSWSYFGNDDLAYSVSGSTHDARWKKCKKCFSLWPVKDGHGCFFTPSAESLKSVFFAWISVDPEVALIIRLRPKWLMAVAWRDWPLPSSSTLPLGEVSCLEEVRPPRESWAPREGGGALLTLCRPCDVWVSVYGNLGLLLGAQMLMLFF